MLINRLIMCSVVCYCWIGQTTKTLNSEQQVKHNLPLTLGITNFHFTFQLASSWNSMILMNPPIRIPGKENQFNSASSPATECHS